MEQLWRQELPVDPAVVEGVVNQIKSHGIFDRFRYDSLSDVDTKPAYQNLSQRVDGFVTKFLSTEEWNPDLNKNELRNKLRRQIEESGMLATGVDHVVDQVVNPKINRVFMPKVEEVVSEFLIAKKRQEEEKAAVLSESSSNTSIKTEPQAVTHNSDIETAKIKPPGSSGNEPVVSDPVASIIDKPPKKIEDIAVRKELKPVGSPGKAQDVHKASAKNLTKPNEAKSSSKANVDHVKKEPDGQKKIKTEEASQSPHKPKVEKRKEELNKPKSDNKFKDNAKPKAATPTSSQSEKHISKSKSVTSVKPSENKSVTDVAKIKTEGQKISSDKHKEQRKEKSHVSTKVRIEEKKVKEKSVTPSSDSKVKEPSKEKSSQHKDKSIAKSITKSGDSTKEGRINKEHDKSSSSNSGSKNKDKGTQEKSSSSHSSKSIDKDKNRDREKTSSSKYSESSKHKSSHHDKDKHSSSKTSNSSKDKQNRDKSHSRSQERKGGLEKESSSSSKTHDSLRDKNSHKDHEKSKHSSSTSKSSEKVKHHGDSQHSDKSHTIKRTNESKESSNYDKEKHGSSKARQKPLEAQKDKNNSLGRSNSSSSLKVQDSSEHRSIEISSSTYSSKSKDKVKHLLNDLEKSDPCLKEKDSNEDDSKADISKSSSKLDESQNDKREKVNNSNPILKTKAPVAGSKDGREKVDNLHPILKTKSPSEVNKHDDAGNEKEHMCSLSEKSSSSANREALELEGKNVSLAEQETTNKDKHFDSASHTSKGEHSAVKKLQKDVMIHKNSVGDVTKKTTAKQLVKEEESAKESDEEESSSEDSDFDLDKSDSSSSSGEDSDSAGEVASSNKDGAADENKDYSSSVSDKSPRSDNSSMTSSAASPKKKTKLPFSSKADAKSKNIKKEQANPPSKKTIAVKEESPDEDSDSSSTSESENTSDKESSSSSGTSNVKNLKVKIKIPPRKEKIIKDIKVENTDSLSNQLLESKKKPIKHEENNNTSKSMNVEIKSEDSVATAGVLGCRRKRKLNPKYASNEYTSIFNSRMQIVAEDSNGSPEDASVNAPAKSSKAQVSNAPEKVTKPAPVNSNARKKSRARSPSSSSDDASDDKSSRSNSLKPPTKRRRKGPETEYKITLKISKVQEGSCDEDEDEDDNNGDTSSDEADSKKNKPVTRPRGRPKGSKNIRTDSKKTGQSNSKANDNKPGLVPFGLLTKQRASLRDRRKHSESGESVSSDRPRRKSIEPVSNDKAKGDTSKQETQQRSSKRYDSSDLYKPRPVIQSSTRRSRAHSPPAR